MLKCNKTQDIEKKSLLQIRLISSYVAQDRNIVSGYLKVYFMKCKKMFYLVWMYFLHTVPTFVTAFKTHLKE